MKKIGLILGSRVDSKDGLIILPPNPSIVNMAVPSDIFGTDTTQRYPIGTRLYKYGKIYRYSLAGEAILTTGAAYVLKVNGNWEPGATGHENVNGFEGALYAAGVAGRTYVDIADTTSRAKNYYEGAQLVLERDADAVIHHYLITGNDANADDLSHVRVYIPAPGLKQDYAISGTAVDAYMSPYSNIISGAPDRCVWASAMGLATFPIASGKYFWLLTAGLASAVVTATGMVGGTASRRIVFANTDGSLTDAYVASLQQVGYVPGRTVSGYGSLCIMLTLEPSLP